MLDTPREKVDSVDMSLFRRRTPETPREEMERGDLIPKNASRKVIELAERTYERGGGIPDKVVGGIEESPPLPDLSNSEEGREFLADLERLGDERAEAARHHQAER